jgi:hypothetical protein
MGWAPGQCPIYSSNWLRLMRRGEPLGGGEPERQAAPAPVQRSREGVERPHCGTYNHPRRLDRLLGPSTASPHAVWKL